jgi:hypothetical protein
MLNLLSIAQLRNQFPLLCTLCRGCLHSSPDRSCNTARLAEGPNKSSWAAPKYPTVNSQKPKPCGPKLELPTSFTRVRRIGARFDGTLQICVSDGTSMRFRTSEYDLCPLQERVLDNRREGVRNKLCVEPYRAAPGGRKPPLMAEVGQSIPREHNIGIVRFMRAKDLRGLQSCISGREPAKVFIQRLPR